MIPDITSRQNAKIKQIRALKQRKHRQESGFFLVEGVRHVGEAVRMEAPIEFILYAPQMIKSDFANDLIASNNPDETPIYSTTSDIFSVVSEKDNPQGIMAVVRQTQPSLIDLTSQTFPWGVAIISPQDPGNLGAILRTINAVGASGLILLDQGVDVYHPKAVRASMGAIFWHPVINTTFDNFQSWALENEYRVYGSSARGNKPYDQIDFIFPAILLLGSEREGLNEKQAQACDHILTLPMQGNTTSLNLSVAAGVLLYEMAHKFIE